MTREEEIHKIANTISTNIGKDVDEDYICNDEYDFTIGFECGAKWADKTMLEKACEWIIEHIDIPFEEEFIEDSPVASGYLEYLSKRLEYAKAVADAFKKAMEE